MIFVSWFSFEFVLLLLKIWVDEDSFNFFVVRVWVLFCFVKIIWDDLEVCFKWVKCWKLKSNFKVIFVKFLRKLLSELFLSCYVYIDCLIIVFLYVI